MRSVLTVLGRLVVCVLAVCMAQPSGTIGAFAHAADPLAHEHDHAHEDGHRDLGRAHAHDAAEPDPAHTAALLDPVDLQGRSAHAPILADFCAFPSGSLLESAGDSRPLSALEASPRFKPPPRHLRLNVLRI